MDGMFKHFHVHPSPILGLVSVSPKILHACLADGFADVVAAGERERGSRGRPVALELKAAWQREGQGGAAA